MSQEHLRALTRSHCRQPGTVPQAPQQLQRAPALREAAHAEEPAPLRLAFVLRQQAGKARVVCGRLCFIACPQLCFIACPQLCFIACPQLSTSLPVHSFPLLFLLHRLSTALHWHQRTTAKRRLGPVGHSVCALLSSRQLAAHARNTALQAKEDGAHCLCNTHSNSQLGIAFGHHAAHSCTHAHSRLQSRTLSPSTHIMHQWRAVL